MSEQPERMAPVFELPPLPYDLADLEPTLSARTLAVHHGKHHARYVDTLNRLLAEENFSAHSLEEIIAIARASETTALFNNAAQAWNHAFFWESMAKARSAPSGPLAEAIQAHVGSTAFSGSVHCCGRRSFWFGLGLADCPTWHTRGRFDP